MKPVELKQIAEQATPGPWRYSRTKDDGIHCVHALEDHK